MSPDVNFAFPHKELVYALRGIVGDIFTETPEDGAEGGLRVRVGGEAIRSYFHPSELEMVRKLLDVACDYKAILGFLSNNTVGLCPYKRSLAKGVDEALLVYKDCVLKLEKETDVDPLIPLTRFLVVLKYQQLMEKTKDFVVQIQNDKVSPNTLISRMLTICVSGSPLVRSAYKIVLSSCINVFYADLWSWMIYGYLRGYHQNKFFVRQVNGVIKLDAADLPSFVTLPVADKIYFTGQVVRHFASNEEDVVFSKIFDGREEELYQKLQDLKASEELDVRAFAQFIENTRSIAAQYSWRHIMVKEKVLHHFQVIKEFYLTDNESIWQSFVEKVDSLGFESTQFKNAKRLRTLLENIFIDLYAKSESVDELLSRFNFSVGVTSRIGHWPQISLEYELSTLLQRIFKKDTFKKYNKLFNFLLEVYRVRLALNRKWLLNMKKCNKTHSQYWFLRHKLLLLIEHVYYFYKVDIIERLSLDFVDDLKSREDYEAMQFAHQKFIHNLMRESLLDIEAVESSFCQLFSFCHQFCECDANGRDINLQPSEWEEKLDKICSNLYYLFTNIKSFELSPSLHQLIHQIRSCLKRSSRTTC